LDILKVPSVETSEKYITISHLPPWSRVFLEKLIVAQPVKKFLVFYGTNKMLRSRGFARNACSSNLGPDTDHLGGIPQSLQANVEIKL
jgi:hypothetical protein